MIASSPRTPRWVEFVVLPSLCASMILFAGCEDEQPIQSYRVPRPQVRLLGVMIPSNNATWFVKMMGPAETMASSKADFDSFLHSLRFENDDLIWTKPDDWKDARNVSDLTYATMRASNGLAVTISKLGSEGARNRLAIINRWLGQVGLAPLKAAELDKLAPPIEIAGVKTASMVDISGKQGQIVESEEPTRSNEAQEREKPSKPIEFVAADDWKQKPPTIPEHIAVYQAGDGANSVDISITRLGGNGGGLDENLKRWGRQAQLFDLPEIKKHVVTTKIAGESADRLDMTGSEGRRIVAIMCLHRGAAWIFKMIGADASVEKQRPAFEEMLKSVRFANEE